MIKITPTTTEDKTVKVPTQVTKAAYEAKSAHDWGYMEKNKYLITVHNGGYVIHE